MKSAFRIFERILLYASLLLTIVLIMALVAVISRPSETGGNQSTFAGSEQQKKRLAVFLDGTWNAVNSNTNVWRMRALCASKGTDAKPQLIYYEVGVNGFLGGIFGQGLDENIRLAYEWLVENYNDGDEIFIFGFSRGAYTARSLAGLVAKLVILKPGSPIGISELFDRYKRSDEETIWELKEQAASGNVSGLTTEEQWMLKYSLPAKVKVIGVWDTVGSLGLKTFSIDGIGRSTLGYLHTGLRIHIQTVITLLLLTSIVTILPLRFGMSGIPRIRLPSLRILGRSKALNNAGSLARMLMSEEAIRPIYWPRRRFDG